MKIIFDNLIDNHIIYEPQWAGADRFINLDTEINKNHLQNVEFIRLNLKYTDAWKLETDIFEYFKPESLRKLREEQCLLFLDITLEGWSPRHSKITVSLHQSCRKNQIDLRKVYYLTSNHREAVCYSVYLYTQNEGPDNINIVENIMISELSRFPAPPLNFKQQEKMCEKFHADKLFLQLSRRNRTPRLMANYELYRNNLTYLADVSQDKLTEHEIYGARNEFLRSPYLDKSIEFEEIKQWNDDHLPYMVDYTDFNTNWAAENGPLKYHKTLFSVVLETSVEDVGGTSMFISEKTFKAIMNRHPLIIFGQKGCNHFLHDLGFKTYENYFNISKLDFENDTYLRYKMIIEQVKMICQQLKKQSLKERIKWRFQHMSIIEHNYNLVFHSVHSCLLSYKLHQTIKSYFDGNFHSKFNQNPLTS